MFLVYLMRYWQPIAAAALAMLITGYVSHVWHGWATDRLNASHAAAMAEQVTLLRKECDTAQNLTKGVSSEYQKKNTRLSAELARVKRLYGGEAARCVPVASNPAGHSGAATGAVVSGAHGVAASGITSGALIDYAGDAEQVRLRLIGCQDFVRRVWAAHGR